MPNFISWSCRQRLHSRVNVGRLKKTVFHSSNPDKVIRKLDDSKLATYLSKLIRDGQFKPYVK